MSTTDGLRLLLYGDCAWDRLASSYQRAFEALGHSVTVIDVRSGHPYIARWLRSRIPHRLTIRSLRLRRLGARLWNEHLLEMGRTVKPHVLLVVNGDLVMPETLRVFRERGTAVFILHADNPFPPHYNNRPETLPCAMESDCYFIWSPSLCERLRRIGVRRSEYLPFAWDPQVFPHEASGSAPAYECDLVFVGGWDEERETWLAPLADRFHLTIWGPAYWGTRTSRGSRLRRCWQGRPLSGSDAAGALRRSRIALNVFRRQNLPDGVIMRTFELPGCGVFSLSTRSPSALSVFPEGAAGAYFSTPEELQAQIQRYLADDAARFRIAERAHSIACRSHTYTHRARQILLVYRELSSGLRGGAI